MIEKKKLGIIIEARTNSKRFKNKILKKIYKNYSVLDYILKKLKTQKIISNIVVATTTKKNDITICKICKKRKISFFRGSENNLIKRVSDAAKHNKIEHIIQLTSDNPFVDIKILKKLIKIYSNGKYDFVSNSLKRSFPIGSDIRIFSLTKLLQNKNKVKGSNKQHTCHYFLTNFKRLRYFNLMGKKSFFRPNYRLTLDYPEDLKLFKIIIKKLKNKVNLKNVIKLLDNNPDLAKINMNKKNPYYWI
jgi:spore coat polysaccharide biosynthesis protein SpsF